MPRILVVDDSASMREMVGYSLESAGHEVSFAVDGVHAIKVIEAADEPFDAILTDIHMPNMDGLELLRNIRAMDDYRFTPVIVLTTDTDDGVKAEGKAAGATGWVVKPFNPQKLIQSIARVV